MGQVPGAAPGGAQQVPRGTRWTEEQRLAIEAGGTDVLVSASAGTGKTAVLVERVIRRILDHDRPADVDRLLVVTFTEAAAAEMRERVLRVLLRRAAEVPEDERIQRQLALFPRAQISTIHSFCLSLVKEHFHELGLDPEIRVMDEHEAQLLRLETLDRLFEARYAAEDPGFLDLVDRYAGDRGDEPLRQMLLDLHSYARGLPDAAGWLRSAVDSLNPPPGTGLGGTRCGHELAAIVRAIAGYLVNLLDEALACCWGPGGPVEYADILLAERGAFAEIEQASRYGDWPAVVAAAGAPSKARLPQSRGSDTVARAAARAARDEAWKRLARLRPIVRPEEELLAELREVRAPMAALAELVIELDETAREHRASRGLLDFADLEFYALKLLEAPEGGVARKLRGRFEEVFVDEYQDINAVQHALLNLVSRGNLFCIGDVKQSIYRFRGTDPGFFRRLKESFTEVDPQRGTPRGEPPGPSRLSRQTPAGWWIGLTRNFRSRRAVIDAVNFVFGELMRVELAETDYGPRERLQAGFDYGSSPDPDAPVELYVLERGGADAAREQAGTGDGQDRRGVPAGASGANSGGSEGPPGESPEEGSAASDDEQASLDEIEREAELVARRIRRMVEGAGGRAAGFSTYDTRSGAYRPVCYRDVAVLLRAVRGRANRYLETFARLGIPVRADLSTGYFSAIEVETMLALLRVIDNPRQDIPLAAVLRSPVVGLDERELAVIRAGRMGRPYFEAVVAAAASAGDGISPDGSAAQAGHGSPAGAASCSSAQLAGRLRVFLNQLASWRTAARRRPLSDLIWRLLQETGYLGFAGGLPGGAQRQANLLALHDRAREFDRFARQGLARFLRFVEQLHENESDLGAVSDPGEGADAVLLTSIHKSKGLEFPVVFLPDLGRQFRRAEGRDVLWHAELGLGPVLADRGRGYKYATAAWHAVDARLAREELAEEMRLLYVGMTRARERLVLSGSVRGLASRLGAWGATAGGGAFIPETVLRTDATYLNWVCRALARHRCGEALRGEGAGRHASPEPPWSCEDPSNWRILLVPAGVPLADDLFPPVETTSAGAPAPVMAAEADLAGPLSPGQWEKVQRLEPLPQIRPERLKALEQVAGWRYPAPARTRAPAKQSVSRLGRQLLNLAGAMEEADPVQPVGPVSGPPAGFRGPELRPWTGRRPPDAAELGMLTHVVLRNLDLAGPFDIAALKAQGLKMERAGLLADRESSLVDWADLAWFFSTPLGRLLCEERALVRREVSFSLAVPAVEVISGLPGEGTAAPSGKGDPDRGLAGEMILVQGMIDCLVDLPSGPVILDFKTDRVAAGELEARAAVYGPQIAMYCRAVRESLGVPVREAWLVFLRAQAFRPVPVG